MLRPKQVIFLLLTIVIFATALSSLSQKPQKLPKDPQASFKHFPIAEVGTEKVTDPALKAQRAAKGKKFNRHDLGPIDESFNGAFLTSDWAVGLPALPTERSSAVIIGRVDGAEAYLSENKTTIYSEFNVNVEVVFKNENRLTLKKDSLITIQREGGKIKFPSGKIAIFAVDRQDMPEVGKKYVFFLTDFLSPSNSDDLFILTAYELTEGKVFPLDHLSASHPINKYAGVSETEFLTDLSNALAKPVTKQK